MPPNSVFDRNFSAELIGRRNIMHSYKTDECLHKNINFCAKGKFCHFYHDAKERRRDPFKFNYLPHLCEFAFGVQSFNTLICPKGDDCPFCHNDLEVLYHPENYKKKSCSFYHPNDPHNSCAWGDLCSCAHGNEELLKFQSNSEKSNSQIDSIVEKLEGLDLNINGIQNLTPCLNIEGMHLKKTPLTKPLPEDSPDILNSRSELSKVIDENVRLAETHQERFNELLSLVMKKVKSLSADEMNRLEVRTNQISKISKSHLSLYDNLVKRIRCPNCVKRNREAVLIPCGHMFCLHCLKGLYDDKKCFKCNQRWNEFQKI